MMLATTRLELDSRSIFDIRDSLSDLLVNAGREAGRRLTLTLQIRQERRELQSLSASSLQDIGVERHIADRESRRSMFDIPSNRTW